MTEAQTAAAVYACSAVTITLLWGVALRNRANGWRRERHPNCFMPLDQSTPAGSSSFPRPASVALGPQLLTLHNAIARSGVSRPATPVSQNQYVEDPAAAAKSMK